MSRPQETLSAFPAILREWHPTKNNALHPATLARASNRKVWWQCPRESQHVYEATISHRTVMHSGCPFCAGKRVLRKDSLAGRFQAIAAEWHPTRNGDLRPDQVTPTSGRRVFWQCRHGHIWQSSVSKRTTRGQGCPYCGGYRVTTETSLAGQHPAVAAEWHPTKNGKLRPDEVSAKSGRRVWWRCSKEAGHVWQTSVRHRTVSRSGCPHCHAERVALRRTAHQEQRERERAARRSLPRPGRRPPTLLSDAYPAVAAEWHAEKNGSLTADQVGSASVRSAWWRCAKGPDHVWRATILTRTARGQRCPFCADRRLSVTNSLATRRPELAAEWHPRKNRGRKPSDVRWNDSDRAWWRCPADARHVFRMEIARRVRGVACPFCADLRPEPGRQRSGALRWRLVREWDRERNGALDPRTVRPDSPDVVWWRCAKDPEHRWQAPIRERSQKGKGGCPNCFGRNLPRSRTLAARAPELAAEWHPTKNAPMRPETAPAGSRKRVWWRCPKGADHEWQAPIASRVQKHTGCPFCLRARVSSETSLAAQYPELAAEWHPTKNGALQPDMLLSGSQKMAWWLCAEGPDHEWRTTVAHRTSAKSGCPFCAGQRLSITNCLATRKPALAAEWHPTKNRRLTPQAVFPSAKNVVWWKCKKGSDHAWEAPVFMRALQKQGCPFCAGKRASVTNSLAALFPKVAAEWHPTRNGSLKPADVVAGSKDFVWWRCPLAHTWRGRVRDRTSGGRACPACAVSR